MAMDSLSFKSATGVDHSPSEVASAIIEFMKGDTHRSYVVTIGTDSELYGKTAADFVTAIVVHRVGNGARYFWRRMKIDQLHTMRDRILQEVLTSLDTGENGETRTMIQELVGIIRANDFEAKTKPESYAASSVADRHV